ncbi:ABC transporter ATP-binding protein [Vagococcus carniphilus]|uniref:ABC transporter ATP-binding protein n=1 Tax=Vagococcus carniphilus TaxID=218144 RepID=UPI00288FD9E8|nr:ABC transporter ATP-binding protein [Vagococcus carniphilus]MDT2830645.1 ABC transporter ATP-binding protein [Vagococcus carniphilus]MDT2839945.1 ABC transporter ATP-binding protein [Vagococcus carniphilus]MDT2854609.1 ABC transporter ATP-binding protein [Vagococcus carniphilus]
MTYMKQFLKRNKGLFFLTIIALAFQTIGTLAVPFLIGKLIDTGISSGNQKLVISIGIQMLIVAIIGSLAAVLGSFLSAKLAANYGYEIRKDFYQKTQELSIQKMDSFGVSSLLTRMMNDVTNVQRALMMIFQLILPAPIICVFAIVMTFINSPTLAIIPLISIVIYLVAVFYLLKKGLPLSSSIQQKLDAMVTKLREFFNGINMIRAFDNQETEETKTNHRFKDYADSMIAVNKIFSFLTPVAYLIMGLVFSLIIWVGSLLVGQGQLQIGTVTAIIEYSMQTLGYLIVAAMVLVTLPRSIASLKRIDKVLETPSEFVAATNSRNTSVTDDVLVRFDDVTFSYNDAEPILENISFDILKGKTTAIVGGTGSGKSTVAKLLLNLSDINSGDILVHNRSLSNWKQEDLRQIISYTPQKAFLFSGSIESNLLMGNSHASKNDMDRAIKTAQADSFIFNQKEGYQTAVSQGGSNFSGGQKQRISIARALIKPADLYVFDDSFSALDYQTDAKLRKALKTEMSEQTFLIIAQRLSTIQEADQIIVLDEGKIVGKGTHEVLLSTNKIYQEFAISQGIQLKGEDKNDSND